MKYDLGYLYLIGYRQNVNDDFQAYYRLDRIYSFEITRNQTYTEREKVKVYMEKYFCGIAQMYGGEFIEITLLCKQWFYSYLHDKFRTAEIISQEGDEICVKINAFEDGFVKWIISQPHDMMTVLQPKSIRNKLADVAEKISSKYGGV